MLHALQVTCNIRSGTAFQVLRQCAQQEGFDVDLIYRLLAICSANGDKFCKESTGKDMVKFGCKCVDGVITLPSLKYNLLLISLFLRTVD